MSSRNDPQSCAVIYCRYSSKGQRDVSIDQQIKACQEYADRVGLTVVDVYDDHAMTGTNDNRPAFQKMIIESSARKWTQVLVYALDRFARDRYDSAVHKHTLKENGVRVVSVTEPVSDDPTGVLIESMLEGFAEYYSKELRRKIMRGQQYNAEHCLAGPKTTLPLGYDRGPDGHYVINEKEAEIVREIFNRVLGGEKIIDIYTDLNSRGIRTKKGKEFNKSSFGKMLSNERYIGTYIWSTYRIENGIPAIIDHTTFQAVQDKICTKPNPRSPLGSTRRRTDDQMYMLTGKLRCGKCGAPMTGISGTGKMGKKYFYYICKNHRDTKVCDMVNVPRDKLESWVVAGIKECILSDENIEWLADLTVKNDKRRESAKLDVELLESQIKENEKKQTAIVDAIVAGLFTEQLKERSEQLTKEKSRLEARLEEAKKAVETSFTKYQIMAGLQLIREGIDIMKPTKLMSIFDGFIREVQYDGEVLKIAVVYVKDGSHRFLNIPLTVDEIEKASYEQIECSYKASSWRCEELIRTPPHLYLLSDMAILVMHVVLT